MGPTSRLADAAVRGPARRIYCLICEANHCRPDRAVRFPAGYSAGAKKKRRGSSPNPVLVGMATSSVSTTLLRRTMPIGVAPVVGNSSLPRPELSATVKSESPCRTYGFVPASCWTLPVGRPTLSTSCSDSVNVSESGPTTSVPSTRSGVVVPGASGCGSGFPSTLTKSYTPPNGRGPVEPLHPTSIAIAHTPPRCRTRSSRCLTLESPRAARRPVLSSFRDARARLAERCPLS